MRVSLQKRNKTMNKLWMFILVAVLLTGCSSQKKTPTHQYGGFQYKEIEDYSPFDSAPSWTPYVDSIIKLSFEYWEDWEDWGKAELIGGIDRYDILKHETRDSIEAIVYRSHRYNDFFNTGISVAYSSNNGSTWDYYYTGLTQDAPMYIKWYSKYPLIDAEGNVQIEACLRSGDGNTHWGWMTPPVVVKDGLLITFDLETLRKDSDGDGLTDIEEARLRTDPFRKDTDNDGIPDDLDLNPRCNVPRTDKTIIYESIINGEVMIPFYDEEDVDEENPLTTPIEEITEDTTRRTVMIVTDDPDIRSIQPKNQRVIFLSPEEMGDSKYCSGDLERIWVYSLEKQEDGSYEVNVHRSSSGNTYRIVKTLDGWAIEIVSSYIE